MGVLIWVRLVGNVILVFLIIYIYKYNLLEVINFENE